LPAGRAGTTPLSSLHQQFRGAELNAEIEHQTARDSTVHGEKPLGARGAAMADTIGAAT